MDTLICLGESLNLEPPVFDITDFPNIQHQWISLPNFELLDSTYHLSLSPATSITLGRIDENGACTDTLFSNIVVIDSLVDITTDNANICEGESLQLIATVEEETTDFQWFPSDNLSCTDCLDPIVMPAQTTNYRIVGAIQDCSFEGNIEVNVTNVSEINLENRGEAIIYIGSEVDLVLHNNGLNFLSIEWLENGKVIAEANDTILNYAPLINEALTKEDRSVLIEANMITIDGCAFNTQVTILVKPPKIPNAFTPGTDGMNDYFNLFGNPTAASIGLFKIYNRWGKLVYDNDEPEKGWNGRLNNQGKMLPADVYLYQIQLKIGTEMKTFSGDVTLIR
jgi:gliding motility-associated-like protein